MSLAESEVRELVVSSLAKPIGQAGLDPSALADDFDLIGSGIVDSLGFLELIAELEERLGLELDFEGVDPEQLTLLGGLCACVASESGAEEP